MKRRDFFTKLGLGVVAAMAAPSLLTKESPRYFVYEGSVKIQGNIGKCHLTPAEVLKKYKQSGNLMYSEAECYSSPCNVVRFLNKKEEEVACLIIPHPFNIVFWDVITLDRDYIVSRRAADHWIAIEA